MHDREHARGLWLALALLAGAGCSTPATDPIQASTDASIAPAPTTETATNAPGFVHLAIGDHAIYKITNRSRDQLTGQEPGPWKSVTQRIDYEIAGTRTLQDREYFQHIEYIVDNTGPINRGGNAWRQDRTGFYFYQNDAFTGVIRDIPFLRYPLHPGQEWAQTGSVPQFRVVARERIHVPAGDFMAWHVRGVGKDGETHDGGDWWYAEPGEVAHHFQYGAYDIDDGAGHVIGVRELEEFFELQQWIPADGA